MQKERHSGRFYGAAARYLDNYLGWRQESRNLVRKGFLGGFFQVGTTFFWQSMQ